MARAYGKAWQTVFCTLLLLSAALSGGCSPSRQAPMFDTDTQIVKGRVQGISADKETLVIKPRQGETVTVKFSGETALESLSSTDEIEKQQPLEVVYKTAGDGNMALLIRRLPEGECQ